MTSCTRWSLWLLALQLFRKTNGVLYGIALSACAEGAQWHTAVELLKELYVEALEGHVIHYGAALKACAAARQWRMALELILDGLGAYDLGS